MFAASKTAGASSGVANYIEDVFSTYLYTGNGSTQTITNGIDLSTKGGLVWIKSRNTATDNVLYTTNIGTSGFLYANGTSGLDLTPEFTSFNANGFSVSNDSLYAEINVSSTTYASWSFRKQPKFFDIQTWTGTGSNRTISHSLGSVPACIMVKRTNAAGAWQVYHSSLANTEYLVLNTTAAKATGATRWNSTTPTSTVFSLGTDATVNASGGTYVAYIFASNSGGFGLTGTDNVISCGSFTTDGSGNATVSLGYEPQWMLLKQSSGTAASWTIVDSMRGFVSGAATTTSDDATLNPNNSNEEGINNVGRPTATSFEYGGSVASQTFIYIAIRRGPMKVPTSGTSVFAPIAYLGGTADLKGGSNGFPTDLIIDKTRDFSQGAYWSPRLTDRFLLSSSTDSDTDNGTTIDFDVQSGANLRGNLNFNDPISYIAYFLKRAPSFMDVVCYTGTGANRTLTHNLGVVPEMIIVKKRSVAADWEVYQAALGATNIIELNLTGATSVSATRWNNTAPTSSVFSLGTHTTVNASGATYVAYLFATCAGVSKVGSYTGTATTKQIDCGFTAGARFVLIKRTDSTGDWYVWDSARGIVAGNDPYLLINAGGVEVTSTDYIDTYSAGFEISSTAPAAINASGGSFIFLAIA